MLRQLSRPPPGTRHPHHAHPVARGAAGGAAWPGAVVVLADRPKVDMDELLQEELWDKGYTLEVHTRWVLVFYTHVFLGALMHGCQTVVGCGLLCLLNPTNGPSVSTLHSMSRQGVPCRAADLKHVSADKAGTLILLTPDDAGALVDGWFVTNWDVNNDDDEVYSCRSHYKMQHQPTCIIHE